MNTLERFCAGLLFRNSRTEVALIRKKKPEFLAGLLNGIGGKVEDNETPYHAMFREFQEETGALTDLWRPFLVMSGTNPGGIRYRVHWYVSDAPVQIRSAEDELVDWYGMDMLFFQRLAPNLEWIIPMAASRDTLVATVDEVNI